MLNKIRKALLGFRKYSFALIIVAVTVWFRLVDLINGDNVEGIFVGVGAAFMASNLGKHIVDVIKEKAKEQIEKLKKE